MNFKSRVFFLFLIFIISFTKSIWANESLNIPILCYHNFNPGTPGSMNMKPNTFETQLRWLKENGFTIIPLKEAVAYLQGKRMTLPEKSVVITIDDGWKSVYTYALPLIKKYQVPVTLFIYPQTISEGKNAMTWEELKALKQTGLFDIEGHTNWHPNFKHERKHRTPSDYEKFVKSQLVNSKKIIEEKLGTEVTLLAWPFGIYDRFLEDEAKKAGYVMAFSIDDHTANKSYSPMAQPRFMILESQSMKSFIAKVNGAKHQTKIQ